MRVSGAVAKPSDRIGCTIQGGVTPRPSRNNGAGNPSLGCLGRISAMYFLFRFLRTRDDAFVYVTIEITYLIP